MTGDLNKGKAERPGVPGWNRQHGMSLFVVLIMLLVVTLLGLAVVRGVTLRERMSSNMYDRSLAFQAAESALREAEAAVRNAVLAGAAIGVDCSSTTASCPVPPADAYTGGANGWIDGTAPQTLSAGRPQYYIQYLGQRDSVDKLSLGYSANANQYGSGGGVQLESFYRIIARSHDPANGSNRSLVVLQSNITVK
ncbi:PilX N-terminal domain-containing pilus assembly protein [Stenotrophomonas sp. MMGLT7]|uniref:pilus assembly PilX family protein n=1 Tax=Stenotrophomonas sp. MMGLT7 TaxID=2901227 RepID=UPI001E415B92|nr:PilX N-terminal domain-containing pilus assembly protein [Stenotrophomonas sp. MMGLT7]MCD7098870.1 PilX N-terminal domain-containing pilus assembly protein [Stenotrophomonas sp. MMGLT7]